MVMGRPKAELVLSADERSQLMSIARSRSISAALNLSAFLWARRLNNRLSARLRKPFAEQDSKLVHR